jgi:DNA (cytosine-5)-methyltransferase 1
VAKTELRFIDLFSGAGGLAQGFRAAGSYRSVFAVELERAFAASYEANFGHAVFQGYIENLELRSLPEADIVIGGPPCQGFSPLGKMSGAGANTRLNALWRQYLRVVDWVKPLAFVIENVPEFLTSVEFAAARRQFEPQYYVVEGVLKAVDFGVAQKRRRGFVIGIRADLGIEPTLPVGDPNCEPKLRDFIWNLRNEPLVYDFRNGLLSTAHEARELHIGRQPTAKSVERYRCIPPGGNRFDLVRARRDLAPKCWLEKKTGSTDVFGRLEWGKPALTIRTEFFKPEKGRYLHPDQHRPITHREAARIQTFPDGFKFCGSKTEIARQIGNAVPPKLAEAVARHLLGLLQSSRMSKRTATEPK